MDKDQSRLPGTPISEAEFEDFFNAKLDLQRKESLKAPRSATSNFDFGDLIKAQDEQSKRRLDKEAVDRDVSEGNFQVEEAKATNSIGLMIKGRGLAQASKAVADNSLKAHGYLFADSAELARIEEEAIRLSNSSNPGDRLSLYFKQLRDPRYTLAYNSQRQTKLVQTSEVMSHEVSLKQQAYARQLDMLKRQTDIDNANLDFSMLPLKHRQEMATLSKDQGDAAVASLADVLKTRAAMVAQDNLMQDQVIAGLSTEQVNQAHGDAVKSPEGKINVGGVDLSLGILETAKAAREERDFLSATRVLTAKAQADEATRKTEEIRKKRLLQTFSPEELTQIQLNGGRWKDSTGNDEIFDMKDVKEQYAMKKEAVDRRIDENFKFTMIGDGRDMILQHDNIVKRMPPAEPGTPLWDLTQGYRRAITASAQHMQTMKPGTPEFNEMAAIVDDQLTKAREAVNKGIDEAAKREGAGNTFRTAMAKARLSGEPAPIDLIEGEIMNRLPKGASTADIIGATAAGELSRSYQAALRDLTAQEDALAMKTPGFGGTDIATRKQQAAAIAWEKTIQKMALPPSQEGVAAQTLDPTHPLYSRVTPGRFNAMEYESNAQGENEFAQAYKFDPAAMDKLKNGETVNGINIASVGGEITVLQASALFQRIASEFDIPTAEAVASWWAGKDGRTFIGRFVDTLSLTASKQTPAEYTSRSVTASAVQRNLEAWGQMAQSGIRDFLQDRLKRDVAHFQAFGNEPTNYQVAALTRDESLTDMDRQDIWRGIIAPILAESKQKGLNYKDTNFAVEQALRAANPTDVVQKGLLKRLQKNRQASLGEVDKVVELQTYSNPFSQMPPRLTSFRNMNFGPIAWFKTLGQQTPSNGRPGSPR